MDTLIQDLRFGLRRLRRSPAFALIAILSLALGIGANTAIFTLVNATLLREPPFERPDELLDVFYAQPDFSHGPLSYPDFRDIERDTRNVFTEIAAVRFAFLQRDAGSRIEALTGEAVTGAYFTVRGIRPALGRLLGPEDDVTPGGHPVVVLSHAYWTSAFAQDRGVLGRELRINGSAYQVIGVAPSWYSGAIRGYAPQVWLPMMMTDRLTPSRTSLLEQRDSHSLFATARLAPGVPEAAARTALANVRERLRAENPDKWENGHDLAALPTRDVIVNPMFDDVLVAAATLLTAVVGLVLLIACANLAGFLLAQAQDRRREIAIRLALGAHRRSLVRQLFTETTALAIVGGLVGALLSSMLLDALMRADLPLPFPITLDLAPDARTFAFTFLVSVAAGLLFGLAPAIQSTHPDVAGTLKEESAGGAPRRKLPLRDLLVAGQMAVSLVLLMAGGLFVRSFTTMRNTDPGFGHMPAAMVAFNIPSDRYTEAEGLLFMDNALRRVAAIPGVSAAGMTSNIHLNVLNTNTGDFTVPGIQPPAGRSAFEIDDGVVDAGFFDAAGISIVNGRNFDPAVDLAGSPDVIIVNEAVVDLLWPGDDAVGRSIFEDGRELRVIGVARTVRIRSLGEAPRPFVYRPFSQAYTTFPTLIASTPGSAEALLEPLAGILRSLDPDVVIFEMETMERHLATLLVPMQLGAVVISGVALLALCLASIGLYGVVSYAVARRTREVGIRMSLGARPGDVVQLLMRSGLKLVAGGAAAGLLLAFASARALRGLLFGVQPLDPLTFSTVPATLLVVALLAAWLPARRATHIDPMRSLRS